MTTLIVGLIVLAIVVLAARDHPPVQIGRLLGLLWLRRQLRILSSGNASGQKSINHVFTLPGRPAQIAPGGLSVWK